jgi:hypothetical protein
MLKTFHARVREGHPEVVAQWGWGGFVTHDLARCRLAVRLVALFYDWWNIFVRLAEPDRHREAVTSRPLLLHVIGERARHARATTIKIASTMPARFPPPRRFAPSPCSCAAWPKNAEQLTNLQRWREILAGAFRVFLNSRSLRLPPRLAQC